MTVFTSVKLKDENWEAYGVEHINNKPRVSSMPYLFDIAEGNVANHKPFYKVWYNWDVWDTEEDITTQWGSYYRIPEATYLEVISDNADDTREGTGVQEVMVTYLTEDYLECYEIFYMDGTNAVRLEKRILRVNSIRATQVWTGLVSAGTIDVRTVDGTNIVGSIAAGYTRDRWLTYTVPLGKTLYLTSVTVASWYTTAGKVVRWTARAQVDDTDNTVRIPFFMPFFETITQDASLHVDFDMPIAIPATADLKISATSDGAGSFCSASLRWRLE